MGRRYFLAFSKTHHTIVSLAGAIHIFQNTLHGQKTESLMHFLQTTLVENGSLVQHQNDICPGLVCQWGPMTCIGPGSCRQVVGPGSFRSIGPGLWHQPGPMPPLPRGTWRSAEYWSRFMP
jgi:hypothetical protein